MNRYCLKCLENVLALAHVAALTTFSISTPHTEVLRWLGKAKREGDGLPITQALGELDLKSGFPGLPQDSLLQHSVLSLSIKKMGSLANSKTIWDGMHAIFLQNTVNYHFFKVSVATITREYLCSGSCDCHRFPTRCLPDLTGCFADMFLFMFTAGKALSPSLVYICEDLIRYRVCCPELPCR